MADESTRDCSQESVLADEMPAILSDLKEFQVLMQDQATDFMDVLLELTFIRLFKDGINDLTEEEKIQLESLKEAFLETFRSIIGKTVDEIVNHESIQYLLDEIMDTSSKVTESPDYLKEVFPVRSNFLKKLKDFKEEIDVSNETLSKEREIQYLKLKDEVKATKTIKNQLMKRLRRVNQELVDHISNMSTLIREGNDE